MLVLIKNLRRKGNHPRAEPPSEFSVLQMTREGPCLALLLRLCLVAETVRPATKRFLGTTTKALYLLCQSHPLGCTGDISQIFSMCRLYKPVYLHLHGSSDSHLLVAKYLEGGKNVFMCLEKG